MTLAALTRNIDGPHPRDVFRCRVDPPGYTVHLFIAHTVVRGGDSPISEWCGEATDYSRATIS